MDKISLLSLKVKDFDLSNTISGLFLEINKDESTYYLLLGLEMSIEINSDVSCTLNVGHITDYFTLKVSPSNKTMLFNYPPSKKEFDWRCSYEF